MGDPFKSLLRSAQHDNGYNRVQKKRVQDDALRFGRSLARNNHIVIADDQITQR